MSAPKGMEIWMPLATWFTWRGEKFDSEQGIPCDCGCWADLVHLKDGTAEAKCARCAEAKSP